MPITNLTSGVNCPVASTKLSVTLKYKPIKALGFAPRTRVFMADKTIKEINDIVVGDIVVGDDGFPKQVLQKSSGYAQLYLVHQNKGEDYIVTGAQSLVLKATGVTPYISSSADHLHSVVSYRRCSIEDCRNPNCSHMGLRARTSSFKSEDEARGVKESLLNGEFDPNCVKNGDIFVATVDQYFNMCNYTLRNKRLQCFKIPRPIFNISSTLPLDPYLVGVWLGDGSKSAPVIATSDYEIKEYLDELVSRYNDLIIDIDQIIKPGDIMSTGVVATKYTYVYRIKNTNPLVENPIMRTLKDLKIYMNKHIPEIYMNASEEDRYRLLAGLIDTDGHLHDSDHNGSYYKFTQSEHNKIIVEQFQILTESLGFNVHKMSQYEYPPVGRETFKDGRKSHTCYVSIINGKNILKVPCLIERKQANIICKDRRIRADLTTRITIEPIIENNKEKYGECVGISVEGNNHFMLADRTIVSGC